MKETDVKIKDTEVPITESNKKEGLSIVLMNDKNVPVAWYGFDSEKLVNRNKIEFHANNHKIEFVGITPSTKNELCGASE